MTVQSQAQSSQPHALQCLEVWGGTSTAKHAASVPGLDIRINARPAVGSTSGGDLFLVSSCSSGWISRILLADVAGHGDDVSHLSNKLRKAMHKSINTVDQSKLARTLNNAFDEISESSKFATAVLMTYFSPSGHLIFVNAGHPPPLLLRSNEQDWIPLESNTIGVHNETSSEVKVGPRNLPLGIIPSTEYEQVAFKIEPGDCICVYTDAFTEAQHTNGSLIGTQGLADSLKRTQPQLLDEPASAILADFQANGFHLADDDHTLLMIQHNGAPVPSIRGGAVKSFLKATLGLGHKDTVIED